MGGKELELQFPSQGWDQFLPARKKMLDAFDVARQHSKQHAVQVFHGTVGEARIREWLTNFLPKKYGVTSGRIISPGLGSEDNAPHFDVIIYDQLESPTLWIEENVDNSPAGCIRAISVEYVLCVLEVKSGFSTKTVGDSITKLNQLLPLMEGIDDPQERYKRHLPPHFTCGLVFYELKAEEAYNDKALTEIAFGSIHLRRFFGGIVLRGERHQMPLTGKIVMTQGTSDINSLIGVGSQSLLTFGVAGSVRIADDLHVGAIISWTHMNFAQFGFDLIALMQGTYEPSRVSSWYGSGGAAL